MRLENYLEMKAKTKTLTSSVIKSVSTGRAVHLNAAHNANGIKITYNTIVVAAIETRWKL